MTKPLEALISSTKHLSSLMVERFSMNPISCKILNEEWRKEFPDEPAIAERFNALIAALEQAQQQNKELESTLEREREKSRRVMSRNQQLEASQLAVNLPEPLSMLYRDSFEKCYVAEKAYRYSDVIEAIRAAGGAVGGE